MSKQKNIACVDFYGSQRTYRRLLCRGDGWGFALLSERGKRKWFVVRAAGGQWTVVEECSAEQYFTLASIELP